MSANHSVSGYPIVTLLCNVHIAATWSHWITHHLPHLWWLWEVLYTCHLIFSFYKVCWNVLTTAPYWTMFFLDFCGQMTTEGMASFLELCCTVASRCIMHSFKDYLPELAWFQDFLGVLALAYMYWLDIQMYFLFVSLKSLQWGSSTHFCLEIEGNCNGEHHEEFSSKTCVIVLVSCWIGESNIMAQSEVIIMFV